MRIGYFDCFSGISGDMILGSLLHAGVDPEVWQKELAKLNVPGYELKIGTAVKEGTGVLVAPGTVVTVGTGVFVGVATGVFVGVATGVSVVVA